MFIKYNDTNVHALPHLNYVDKQVEHPRTGKIKTVRTLDTNQSPQDIKWLQPGWNEFPKHIWDQNKDHPQIQRMIKKGKIKLMAEKVTVKKGGKLVTKLVGPEDEQIKIRWFDEKRALSIVKDTYNREILQRWLDQETRTKVKKLIEKQLTPLLKTAEDDDAADDEDVYDEDSDSDSDDDQD